MKLVALVHFQYSLENQSKLLEQYLSEAVQHSSIIARAHWFQWSDQPATGRLNDSNRCKCKL